MTNLNFNNGYVYFDSIFIYASDTFPSSILVSLIILVRSFISSTIFDRIPGPFLRFRWHALWYRGL